MYRRDSHGGVIVPEPVGRVDRGARGGIGIIFGVDRLLDMCRTVLNVTGGIVAAVVVARSERALEVPFIAPESEG